MFHIYSKYKFLESSLTQSKRTNKVKIPDIQKALDAVNELEAKRDGTIHTHFELSDNVWANAKIEKPSAVCLWLGVIYFVCFQ